MADDIHGTGYDDALEDANADADSSFGTNTTGSATQQCKGSPYPPGSERAIICSFICACKSAPKKQWCVSTALWASDKASGFCSTIKAEVPYDMTQDPPSPYMSKWEPRPTRRRPADSRIPDVVVVKDGSIPPIQSNIREIFEIKFPGDDWSQGQKADYEEIAGDAPLTVLSPDECGCPDMPPKPPVFVRQDKKQKQKKDETEKESAEVEVGVAALAGLALIAVLLLAPEVVIPALIVGGAEASPILLAF